MEKSIMGLVAAIGAAMPIMGAHAAVTSEEANQALRASSVAELLQPVANSTAILAALDSERQPDAANGKPEGVQMAWHHHHHHHHHFWHHHHHHHHHWWHHHHHHHWY